MRTSGPVVGLWAALVAAGCGTAGAEKAAPAPPPAAAAAAVPPHACTLLPREIAEAVVGERIGEVKKAPDPPASADVTASHCLYASADGMRSMSVLVRHSRKGDNEPGYARGVLKESGMTVEDVPGVGDTAFWAGVQLQAYKGRSLQVVVSMMGFDRPRERAAAAAARVLEKL